MAAKKVIFVIITILFVGSLFYQWHKKEVEMIEMEYRQEIAKLRSEPWLPRDIISLKIYSLNVDTYKVETDCYVAVPRNSTLLQKLKILADKLSKFEFQYHPIKVLKIENRNGKNIALIELKEPDYSGAFTWRGGFFQGSTGGLSTTIKLTETFLQKDYQGEWIDGVEFYYEGQPISDEWVHIRLNGTIFRTK